MFTVDGYAEVPLHELTVYTKNARQGDVGAISESLKAHGQYVPITVNRRDNQILRGNHTFMAAEMLGWATIQVAWVDVDPETARSIVVADNRTSDLADYDKNILAELLDEMHRAGGDTALMSAGFDMDDFNEAAANGGKPNSPWDGRKKQGTGDQGDVVADTIWRVGPHLLACGDSRDPELWAQLLGDRPANLLFTDPPYGVDYDGGAGVERTKLAGDTPDEAVPLFAAVLDTLTPLMAPGAAVYTCLPSGDMFPKFMDVLVEQKIFRWVLVWVKDQMVFGRADYHQQHEMILYGWFPNGARHKVKDRTETSVWAVPRPSDSDRHPTAKPVELAARAIRNSTRPGGIVVEPFAGSGSTLVAAHREDRVGVGVELDPGYVNVALQWLEEETGENRQQVR